MYINFKINEKEKEAFYNGYLDYSDAFKVPPDVVETKEKLFEAYESETKCGKIISTPEKDGSHTVTMDIKENFVFDVVMQYIFIYCKFKLFIDAVVPSVKSFIEKWIHEDCPNE